MTIFAPVRLLYSCSARCMLHGACCTLHTAGRRKLHFVIGTHPGHAEMSAESTESRSQVKRQRHVRRTERQLPDAVRDVRRLDAHACTRQQRALPPRVEAGWKCTPWYAPCDGRQRETRTAWQGCELREHTAILAPRA